MKLRDAAMYVEEEVDLATHKFGPMLSPHEGLAIILEEYEELKAEVFKPFGERNSFKMREEAQHLAAMATRFMVDLT